MTKESWYYLAIDEFEELDRNAVVLVVDRSDDVSDSAFDGLDAGLQRTGLALRVSVQVREAKHRVHRSHLDEVQVFKPLFLFLILPNPKK